MLTGAVQRSFTSRRLFAMALASLVFTSTIAFGQHYMPSPDCGGAASSYGNAYGPCGDCGPGGYGGYGPCNDGGFAGPMPMGYGGTDPPYGYDLMNDVGIAGQFEDQRGPHYFDARLEAVYLTRDQDFSQDITFSRVGSGPEPDATATFLRSDQLDFDPEVGFRVLGRYDIGPLSVVEFGYMGVYDYEANASIESVSNNIFSLFSRPAPGVGNFGVNPVGVDVFGGPMPQTERAAEQSIRFESSLQTAEFSYRRYWVGYSPRISGTLLAGFRWTRVDENFAFRSEAPARTGSVGGLPTADPASTFEYAIDAENNLAGFQTGADMWIGLSQGLRFGTEGKVGLYNNHYSLDTSINANPSSLNRPFSTLTTDGESNWNDQPAFIAEASLDLVADILPSWSLRVGYEVLFINSVALAGDNFNQVSPFGNQGTRVPFVDDQGELFYHGGHAGIEFIW